MIELRVDDEALAAAIAEVLSRNQQTTGRWMTLAEAAEYLRVSSRWLRDRLAEIPHRRIDGKLIFSSVEVDTWTERHREGPAPD
jgi:hypothetical protein